MTLENKKQKLFDLFCSLQDHKNTTIKMDVKDKSISLTRAQAERVILDNTQLFNNAKSVSYEMKAENNPVPLYSKSLIDTGTVDLNTRHNDSNIISKLFKSIPLAENSLHWEVSSLDSPFTLEKISAEGKIKISRLSGETALVKVHLYGAGVDISWEVIEEKRYYQFAESLESLQDAFINKWNEIHYSIITNSRNYKPGNTQNFEGGAGTDLQKLNKTIGKARQLLIKNLKNTVSNAHTTFLYLLLPISKESDIINDINLNKTILDYQRGISTYVTIVYINSDLFVDDVGYLVYPQRKLQNATKLIPKSSNIENAESNGRTITIFTAFGAVLGDTKQVVKVNLV